MLTKKQASDSMGVVSSKSYVVGTPGEGMVRTFRDLSVWQKSHKFVLEIYLITKKFPQEEKYGLITQLRRAAASIPTNIAEGFKRRSKKEYAHFINIADGSLEEVKYHILLAHELGYIDKIIFDRLTILSDEIGRMLFGFHKKLLNYDL
jgi:four helix bundle protein